MPASMRYGTLKGSTRFGSEKQSETEQTDHTRCSLVADRHPNSDHHPALFLPRHLIHNSPAISALGLQPPGFDRSFPFPAFKATCLGVGYVVLGKRRLAHRL